MNVENLLAEQKARFSHNAAKAYLASKYEAKLIVAEQGGLWKADAHTIGMLQSFPDKNIVLIDTFDNPVNVDRTTLLLKLQDVYRTIMSEWHEEWSHVEGNR